MLGLTGVPGVAAGKATGQIQTGAREVGVAKAASELIEDGKIKKARKVLDKSNVPYALNTKEHTISSHQATDTNNELSPDGNYYKSDCELISVLIYLEDDRYLAKGGINFPSAIDYDFEYSYGLPQYIPDGCGLLFDSTEWSAPNPSDEGVNYSDNIDHIDIKHDSFYPNRGITAKVHHSGSSSTGGTLSLETELIKMNTGNQIPIQFNYNHTIALTPCDITVGISGGVLTVGIPVQGSSAWNDELTSGWCGPLP